MSEQPFGIGPHPGSVPGAQSDHRGASDVTIVVEATQRGGARITARHALDYGRSVLAIPGSRRNPSARGCNELLAEGAQPLLDPADVAVALELSPGSRRHPARGRRRPRRSDGRRAGGLPGARRRARDRRRARRAHRARARGGGRRRRRPGPGGRRGHPGPRA